MSENHENEPAFPTQAFPYGMPVDFRRREMGMTLRDYFAAKAMEGLIMTRHPDHHGEGGDEVIARDSYVIADAMLNQREAE